MADQLLGIGTNPSLLASTTITSTSASTVDEQNQQYASKEKKVRSSFAHAASYIMLAYALQPGVKIFEESVFAVQRLLPLPYIRTGLLLVAAPGTASSPEEKWIPAWFALDGHSLLSIRPPPAEAARIQGMIPNIAVEVMDVGSVNICRDPSLPRGWPIFIGIKGRTQAHQPQIHQQNRQFYNIKGGSSLSNTTTRSERVDCSTASGTTTTSVIKEDINSGGLFLIASEREEAEGWVDALRLLGMLGKSTEHGIERLQQALLTRRQRAMATGGGTGAAQASSVVV
jgi:hypothetical protein